MQEGDSITIDAHRLLLQLNVDDAELARRRADWKPAPKKFGRGYGALFSQHVTQADKGCDFDFLHQTEATADPEIH